jgi:hypothetical protein
MNDLKYQFYTRCTVIYRAELRLQKQFNTTYLSNEKSEALSLGCRASIMVCVFL